MEPPSRPTLSTTLPLPRASSLNFGTLDVKGAVPNLQVSNKLSDYWSVAVGHVTPEDRKSGGHPSQIDVVGKNDILAGLEANHGDLLSKPSRAVYGPPFIPINATIMYDVLALTASAVPSSRESN